jgi:RES domain-containing protein
VLYLGLSEDAVKAEFYRFADRQGMPPENLLPRRRQEYQVELQGLLDLRDPGTRSALGLTDAVIEGDDPAVCQAVGDAAHYVGFEGIIAPSATGTGEVLAVFTDKLVPGSSVTPQSSVIWKRLPP